MQGYVRELVEVVDRATPALCALDEEASGRNPAPGKWSPREVIGHLVDSASNNHQRFVRAQFQDDMVFAGYDQDEWVAAQRYQNADWTNLVTLWATFNRHLAHVMAAVPGSILMKSRPRHNLHEIAWQPIAHDKPAMLDDFMRDYLVHLKHHLRQILGSDWDAGPTSGRAA